MTVTRTPQHVRATASTGHVIVATLAGESDLTPADGRAPVTWAPSSLGYGDPHVPYRWELHTPSLLLLVRTRAGSLPLPPAAMTTLVGRPGAAAAGYSAAAVHFARDILMDPATLKGPSATPALRDAVSLLAGALSTRLAADTDPDSALVARAMTHVDAHLASPLTPATVAGAAGVAPRTLQAALQRRGLTLSGWLRTRRLEAARSVMADPAHAGEDLSRIAAEHGFADHSHFTRSFRAAYGVTPSAWRRSRICRSASSSTFGASSTAPG